MKRALILVTILGLTLAGCGFGKSRLNPVNWFGKSRQGEQVATYTAPADPRGLIDTVTTLKVEPYRGGAIVRATGLPPTQGFWDAELTLLPNDGSSQMVYEFRIAPPKTTTPSGTTTSREVTVATSITDFNLDGISAIEVRGAQNALKARR